MTDHIHLTCYQCGAPVSNLVPRDTVIRGWIECPECCERTPPLLSQRDAWRAASRFLYETVIRFDQDGKRPLDLIQKGDWGQIIFLIGRATSLEEDR